MIAILKKADAAEPNASTSVSTALPAGVNIKHSYCSVPGLILAKARLRDYRRRRKSVAVIAAINPVPENEVLNVNSAEGDDAEPTLRQRAI